MTEQVQYDDGEWSRIIRESEQIALDLRIKAIVETHKRLAP